MLNRISLSGMTVKTAHFTLSRLRLTRGSQEFCYQSLLPLHVQCVEDDVLLVLLFVLPATSTMSPGTMSRALTLWTLFLSCLYTLPISGSYSFKASMAFSALRSWRTQQHGKFPWVSFNCWCGSYDCWWKNHFQHGGPHVNTKTAGTGREEAADTVL